MNYDDYNREMAYQRLRSNPIAETHLANAIVCQKNIRVLHRMGDAYNQIPEYQKRKERYIQKALDESWPESEMDYPPDWDINCKFIRDALVESETTDEILLTRGDKKS